MAGRLVLFAALALLLGGGGFVAWRALRWSPEDDLPARWTLESDEEALAQARVDLRSRCALPWAAEPLVLADTSVRLERDLALVSGRVTLDGQALPFSLRAERRPRLEGFSGAPSWSVERLSVGLPDGGTLSCGAPPGQGAR